MNTTTDRPRFRLVPEQDRETLREAHDGGRRLLHQWWRWHFGEESRDESLLDTMLSGVWTFAGWPADMIDGSEANSNP